MAYIPINTFNFTGGSGASKGGVGHEISAAFQELVTKLQGVKPVAGYESLWNDGVANLPTIYAQLFTAATGKVLS